MSLQILLALAGKFAVFLGELEALVGHGGTISKISMTNL
jgi:hypothetical protein